MENDASASIIVSQFDSDDKDSFQKVVGRKRGADERYVHIKKSHRSDEKMASASSCFSILSGSRRGGSDDEFDFNGDVGNGTKIDSLDNDFSSLNNSVGNLMDANLNNKCDNIGGSLSGGSKAVGADSVLYDKSHVGDIAVLVDTSKIDKDRRFKNGLYLHELIKDLKFRGIKTIKAVGFTLYKIFFNSCNHANDFVLDKRLSVRNLRAFIPRSFVESYGVIRDVPIILKDDEILAKLRSSVKVTSVMRFKKRVRNENGEVSYVPTLAVKVGFAGGNIPEEVTMNYTC